MKTKFLIALLALGLAVGCKNEPDYPLNSPADPQYLLALEIVDQAGNNVLKGVELGTVDSVYNEVIYSVYGKQKIGKPEVYTSLENGDKYLILHTIVGIPIEGCPSVLTLKFRSKDIFGDELTHTIESSWYLNEDYFMLRCTSFEFEGKTYVPQKKNGYWTARVVVNR